MEQRQWRYRGTGCEFFKKQWLHDDKIFHEEIKLFMYQVSNWIIYATL